MEFFNSHSWFTSFIMGIVASMEEKNANDPNTDNGEAISAIKSGLMGRWPELEILFSGDV